MFRPASCLVALISLLAPSLGLADPRPPTRPYGLGGVTPGRPVPGGPSKLTLELRLLSEEIQTGTERLVSACLLNVGAAGELRHSGLDEDRIELAIPIGPAPEDLIDGTTNLDCVGEPAGWDCSVFVLGAEGLAMVTFQPLDGTTLAIDERESVCFDLVGVSVNSERGQALSRVEQYVPPSRATPPASPWVRVFKSAGALHEHSALGGVSSDQHHARYTDAEAVAAVLGGGGTGGLEARVAALEALLASFSLEDAGMTVRLTGVNLQVVSGSGATDGPTNGKGNVLIGYDELPAGGATRDGSHLLVVGMQHEYTSFAGIVSGVRNTVSGSFSSVLGGSDNTASASVATVVGGGGNEATGVRSAVLGGRENLATGPHATVSGGWDNIASGQYSAVAGGGGPGTGNQATANYTVVLGGQHNSATATGATVVGGINNTASSTGASVVAGVNNHASGNFAVVVAGAQNEAAGPASAVLSGNVNVTDPTAGNAAIAGGFRNRITAAAATIGGGRDNVASGGTSAISGGAGTTTVGLNEHPNTH